MAVLIATAVLGMVLAFLLAPSLRKRSMLAMDAEFEIRVEVDRWKERGPARRRTERLWFASRIALIGGILLWSASIALSVTLAVTGRLSS